MIRTHFLAHNILFIFLALALFAASILILDVVQPATQPVTYRVSKDVSAASALNRAQTADAARWQGMAGTFARQRAIQADSARWTVRAEAFTSSILRVRSADTARWTGRANAYYAANGGLTTAQLADAARWTALALHYSLIPEHMSPQLELALSAWLSK